MLSCPRPHTSTRNEAAAARTKLQNATGSELYMYVDDKLCLIPGASLRKSYLLHMSGLSAAMTLRAILAGTTVPVGSTAPGRPKVSSQTKQRLLVLRAIVLRGGLEVMTYCPLR